MSPLSCSQTSLAERGVLPVGVVLDSSVCVVVRELWGRSGPARERGEREREKVGKEEDTESMQTGRD